MSKPIAGIRMAGAMPLVLLSTATHAGGLYIGEFGQPNQGASRAGAQAIAEDASTAVQNPSGIMFLDESRSMATGIIIRSEAEFDQDETFPSTTSAVANSSGTGPASDGGDAGGTAIGGAFFHANPVNDKWGWGVALVSVSGAALDYDDGEDFAGRYWASEVDLLTIGLTGSLSFKVTEDVALGLHSSLSYGELDLDVYVPGPGQPGGLIPALGQDLGKAQVKDGDDTVVSYGASGMWQVSDGLRLGLLYNSEIEFEFDSDLDLSDLPPGTLVSAKVELTYPQSLRASATQDLSDDLTLLASVAWEDWSAFEDIPITTAGVQTALDRNWDDTYHFALGLRWIRDPKWTYYTGVAYDTDPTKSSDRTADMPIDRQIRLSGGVTYTRDNGHKIGGVLTLADYGDAKIDNGATRLLGSDWTVKGEYDNNWLIFAGLNYGW